MKKQLLMMMGPQGSGNHIFSRMFSLHPEVYGWKDLQEHYWIRHQREPFAEFYIFPHLLTQEVFDKNYDGWQYYFANISYPFGMYAVRYEPKILEFCQRFVSFGFEVKIVVIVRDDIINRLQQQRLRKKETIDSMKKYLDEVLLPSEFPVHFVSLESFFSYKQTYLKYLSKILEFPIDFDNPEILKFIDESPNKKYIVPADSHPVDSLSRMGIDMSDMTDPNYIFLDKK
jgi:hypothetical protein